ncbi:MAG: amidohydrolase family protein [Bacteroidia bacterium]|nr:amidohydrolase family protein [Bacteroidia bacterium]
MHFIAADTIFNGKSFLPGQQVVVLNNDFTFNSIADESLVEASAIQRFEGILCPGFVNAHCHLELSHLKNKIPKHTGLPNFALEIINNRNNASESDLLEGMAIADHEMFENGIVAVGDISNVGLSIETKKRSKIFYHTFVELIGLAPERSELIFKNGLELFHQFKNSGLSASLAPHAPYSSSKALIEKIAVFNSEHEVSFSIHNQESEDETRFFMGQKNGFEKLYEFLNLDISWFKAPGSSSLQNYGHLLKNKPSVLVHNTFTQKQDIDFVNDKQIYWCFCPEANLYIENNLPDYSLFGNYKTKLCVGTDSSASNSQLNLVEEINVILNATSTFSQEELLAMLTFNGAKALGIDASYGQFVPGKNSGLNLVQFKNNQLHFIKKLV